jgi:mono/diheme cytochrome c family protein
VPRRILASLGPIGPWLAGATVFAIGITSAVAARQTPAAQNASADFFESRIRPILAANCFDCHTTDKKGGLRLDSREALLQGGESGPAIAPGKPDESLLIQAVKQIAGAPKMPYGRPKLKAEDIDALVEWVRGGAPWPATSTAAAPAPVASHRPITAEQRAFWSFQPLQRAAVPAVRDESWPKTDIDRFVLAKLEHEGLHPVAVADRLALIRRATLDLTGLPPTPDEVDAFLKDRSPDAFAKVVDRLLASPRYGEAWGRMWLDVARYGEDDYRSLDPKGRGYNPYPNAYLYRDWVVKAFNDDMPYDRFVRAQLAADLLTDESRVRMLPALGFLGLGPWYYDNGAVEITHADERNDRVDVVGRGLLGLTVACARCHDHKYDPIPTSDYYALSGVFLDSEYHEYPLAPKAVVDDYKAEEKKIEKKQDLLDEFLEKESEQLAQTLVFQASKYMQAAWQVTGEPKKDKAALIESEKLDYELFDRWLRFLDKPPAFYPYLKRWQEMIKRGGTKAEAKKLGDDFQSVLVDVVLAHREVQDENDIIRAKALPGTKKKQPANLPNEFITNDDFCPGCGLELKSLPAEQNALYSDVFQRDLNAAPVPGQAPKPALLSFFGWGLERQLGPDRRALIQALRDDIDAMQKALPEKYAYVHGVQDVATPVQPKINLRGSPYRLGDEVPRGFLSIFSDDEPRTFTKGSGRLELADAILDQPIATRVIVNRIWKGHFGTGLVDTPSNLGANGERPSNPELLDYLARYFVDHKLSIKTLHREIMLSATYQLGTASSAAAIEKDGGDRWYWRASERRMTAEQIRDSVLFVSGSLDLKMGGPSAPLTPYYTRRTIYGRVSRYRLDEYLQLFDFPSASQSAEKRFSTNVPLQRLFFMNSDFMQQQAERLAERVAAEATDEARIQKAYRLIFGRAATPAEVTAGRDFLASEPMRQYQDKKTEAEKAKMEAAKKDEGKKTDAPAETAAKPAPDVAADGMMAGVKPGADAGPDAGKKLPVTTFGRYVKLLLSSNEFIFIG